MLKKQLKRILKNKIKLGVWAGDENNFLFLEEICTKLKSDFIVKKYQFTEDVVTLEKGLSECDVAWFDWCQGPVVAASHIKGLNKPIILRIHRYEVYGEYPNLVNWDAITRIVFISQSVLDHFQKNFKEIYNNNREKILLIPNGVTVEEVNLDRKNNKNVVTVGRIHYHKNPSLLLQIIKKVVDTDKGYVFHIIGSFSDLVLEEYFFDQIDKLNLKENIIYYGALPNKEVLLLLTKMDYYLNTSIIEGQPVTALEAMSAGVKPVIYNYYHAEKVFPKEYLYNTVEEAAKKLVQEDLERLEYRKYIEANNNIEETVKKIKSLIRGLV